ncbi:peptidoglycan-binding domain-containing protein [Methylomarinum sp. Ch1-1]|uniref:Peptidoglycan-binding domain-containing protein n=1 Tax=Methylomarinum roseum TaxID=3067653 RepID=A0AAU7NXA0_9GAMM|nr:peptidoglycan-binding domain-containing protein [Methylomarinum sp. Ch1-1]MDP4522305.1 peptidoglycan-binding domain-containing protein [Methylomarinum sp. Ch1-1]
MKTYYIDARIIVLLAVTASMSGCGDEQKETSNQPEQAAAESVPTKPVSEMTDKTMETIDRKSEAIGNMTESAVKKSAEAVESAAELTVEETAEVAQDLGVTAETESSQAVATGKAATSKASSEVVETTPALVRKIQQALSDAGVNPGPIDGMMGPQTMAAVKNFQKQKGLAEGAITKETLQALGVAY